MISRGALRASAVAVVLVLFECGALIGAAAGPAAAAAPPRSRVACVPRPTPISSDTLLRATTYVQHGRLRTYTMTSAAVGVTHVNVLLPVGYNRQSPRRYPVLYLLHGALGSYADWAATVVAAGQPQGGNVQSLVGAMPIIVVMPDDSPNGSYSDWFGISAKDTAARPVPSTPAWETYHIDELVPWVDSTFPTQATEAGRAIAGLSSGGAGAAKYATSYPGLFGFVGTFSGALDNDLVDSTINWYASSNALNGSGSPDDRCTFGDPFTTDANNSAYYWYDNDPTYKAGNLAGVKLFVASGNGKPTAADAHANPGVVGAQGAIERVVDDMSHHFVAAVRSAGLGANLTTDFYGNGVHGWFYWQRDLASFLRWLQPQLDHPLAPPARFAIRSARVVSVAWGWSFRHDSGLTIPHVDTTKQFLYLSHVSAKGFGAAGNGTLRVVTPIGTYPAGSRYRVVVGPLASTITATSAGQLKFRITLGDMATKSQALFPAGGPPAGMPRVDVSISPVPRRPRPVSHLGLIALGAVVAAALSLLVIWLVRRRLGPAEI